MYTEQKLEQITKLHCSITTFQSRTVLYNARKHIGNNIKIKLDLRGDRYNLLQTVIYLESNPKVKFAFNCI